MHQNLLRNMRFIFILILLLSAGCSKHHQVFLEPSLPIHDSNIGSNIPIALYVEDARSSNTIAKWKKGFRKFSISSQNDLREIFSIKLQQGLKKLGFLPKVHRRNPDHSLKVDILYIKSKYSERVPRMDIKVQAKLRATCNNNGKKYSKTYSAHKKRTGITPATFPNENLLNANLSEILAQIFTDKALLSCLVE
jgi:uncharacterized lipoprotein YajG